MDKPLIIAENLSIGYNKKSILSGISLSIEHSSFTAILGANGSGKSTLLKTLIGLQPPLAGKIRIPWTKTGPVRFGYVPQTGTLDPLYPLTGFDVALMGIYGRVGPGRFIPREESAFVDECLTAMTAQKFASKRFSDLSGGQKQRVLIARALATKPDVLVLDEPTAGVDVKATYALLEFISRINRERKLTILLVIHDLAIVRKHARHVVWLHEGRVLSGTADELLSPKHMAEIFEMEIT